MLESVKRRGAAGRCHLKISARATLFAQICGQRLVVDLGSEERNHPVENPQLKAVKAELPVERNERGNNSTLLSAATARSSARTSCRKNSRSFSRSPSTVNLFPVAKRN